MFYNILKISLFSLLIIFVVHQLFDFFKSTLTVPKIKDLVNIPNQQYERMYNVIHNNNNINKNQEANKDSYIMDNNTMKNDLKQFLKSQSQSQSQTQSQSQEEPSASNSNELNYTLY
jgi:hypothetical protein